MNRDPSIFFQLVRDENSLTELFCNLCKYLAFRRLLTEEINERLRLGCQTFDYDDVTSQERTPAAGQPDVRISNQGSHILIESKVDNRPRTVSQARGYLSILKEGRLAPNVGLLFLVPDDYQHMDAIQRTIEKVATPKYRVAVTTWRNLIGRLEAEGLNETNEVFRDFHAFLKKWFAVEPITFEERELHMIYSRDVGKAYSNLIDFVDQTSDILTRSGYDISRSRNSYEYGFYGKDVSGKRLTWFGIYYGHWESNGCPLTLGVERTLQLPKSLSRRLGESPTEDVGWNIYDIPESALLKKDSQVALAGVLKSVLNCGKQRKKRT